MSDDGVATILQLETHLRKYPALRAALAFSRGLISHVRADLAKALSPYEGMESKPLVAVCGSVGRLEASAVSDLDYMIVYPGPPPVDARSLRDRVAEAVKRAGCEDPNPRGVFAGDVNGDDLVVKIGSRHEDYDNLSRRLLLLLESRPLWNDEYYSSIIGQLVAEYAADVRLDPSKQFVLLLNDLIRYFRTICVNYHNVKTNEHGRWPIRNVKLRHSRIIMYASLLCCIGELSKYEYSIPGTGELSKVDRLEHYVALPPLERFVRLYRANEDDNLFRLLSLYDNFIAALADKNKRTELRELDHEARYESDVFSSLKANSDAFASEVMRFLMARRGAWSDRFFEYLIL